MRVSLASIFALASIIIAIVELNGRRIRLLQCSRETPKYWLEHGPLKWAIRNGLALGCGATFRIGFWLWYVIPVSAFLIANPLLGMILYGTYAITRGLGVWVLILILVPKLGQDFGEWLIGYQETARRITAG
jgi:hypothetical protein